jgi:hypothetical protein
MSDLRQIKAAPATTARAARGRFAKGNAGGPGRPRSVSAGAVLLDRLGVEVAPELLGVAVEQGSAGNLKAVDMVLSRVWPLHRGRPLEIHAPSIQAVADVLTAQAAVTDAVLRGEVTALDGARIASVLEVQRRMIETIDHERRIRELEEKRSDANAPIKW